MGTGTGSIDLSTLNNLHGNLTQHFWFNSDAGATYGTGVHMTLSSQAEFIANPTGQNILMNTDGISIRSGLIPLMVLDNDSLDFNVITDSTQGTYRNVASFGSFARIGAQDGYRAVIDEGSYVILSPDDVELFSFKPSGNPSLDIVAVREDAVGGESTSITLNHTPQSGSFMVFYWTTNSAQQLTTFRAGEAKTTTVGERFRISYDGDKTITIDSLDASSTAYVDYVVYRYISESIDLGALTVGTRQSDTDLGSGSATIGRDLTATQSYQIAVGTMNEGFEDSVFEVGNGKNETRHTAFSVHNNNAIREGYNTTASGDCSHSEGRYTTASGSRSHSEGGFSTASGDYSHSEGYNATASGHTAHAEGSGTKASGICSHAEGSDTIASSDYQHVEGKYNIEDADSKYAHIIGNGTEDTRSNALTVDWDGNVKAKGDIYVNCDADSSGTAHIGQVFNWQGSLKSNLTANAGAYVEGDGSITLKGGHVYLILAYVAMTNSTNGTVDRRAQIFNKTANSAVLTGDKFVASQVWGTVEVQTIYEAYEDVTLTVRGSASRPTTTIPTAWIRAVCIA